MAANDGHAQGPVGRKLLQLLRHERGRKLVSLAMNRVVAQRAAEALRTAASRDEEAGNEPSHHAYVVAQHQLSLWVEQVGAWSEARCFADAISDAEDTYMPVGPPMSPLTGSYFFFWAVCDLSAKGNGETLASATLDLVRELGIEPQQFAPMHALERSRMGLWVHQGLAGDRVLLRELVTDEECRCVVPSGYRGRVGEMWFARVLPPAAAGLAAVVITTPYVLVDTTPSQWLAYLERALGACPAEERPGRYAQLLKYGAESRHWPEFVFKGCVNFQVDAVFLTGLPDIKESLAHA